MYLPELKLRIDFLTEAFQGETIMITSESDENMIRFTAVRGSRRTELAHLDLTDGEMWIRIDEVNRKMLPQVQQTIQEGRFSNLEIDDE